jgi:exosortase/archaeosortase family protein
MKPRTIIITLVVTAVICLFYWPTFRWLWNSWWSSDYYSHGFLIPLISAFFIWTKRDHLKNREPAVLGTCLLALGAGLYIFGSAQDMRFAIALSLIIMIFALGLSFFGTRATRAMLFPLAFLIFMVPFPFIQDLGYRLQEISVTCSTWILHTIGVNTLVALLAMGALYVYLLKGPFYRRSIIFALAFPIAILANVSRIVLIILIAYHHDLDAAMTYHDWLGTPLAFIVALLVLVLLGMLMKCKLNLGTMR